MKLELPKDWFEKRFIDIDKIFPIYNQGREIKFRVWYPNEKKFYHTTLEKSHFTLGKDAWDESYVIQQHTGLKGGGIWDMEIYEGDIVKYRDKLAEIRYETDRGGYIIEWKWNKNQHSHDLTCDSAMECIIIGNIFENPELLK